MAKATMMFGALKPLDKCVIRIPGGNDIILKILPEITDSKSATYNDEPVIGRAFPIKTYSHSDNRTITMKVHFVALDTNEFKTNLNNLRLIQSAVYPDDQPTTAPYQPPPICKIKCGDLLTSQGDKFLCVVMKQYSVSFPTDVVWDDQTYIPYKFDVDMTFDAVFANSDLPGSQMILQDMVS